MLQDRHHVYNIDSAVDYRLVRRGYGRADDSFFVHTCKSQGPHHKDQADYEFKQALKEATKGQDMIPVALRYA